MTRRVVWIGAGAAAATARLVRRAYRARHRPARNGQRLTIRATVAPEVVEDLTDLLRRVTGRAASDEGGGITVNLAPGVSAADVERQVQTVVHRWSQMHPGVRVRVTGGDEAPKPSRRWTARRDSSASAAQLESTARP